MYLVMGRFSPTDAVLVIQGLLPANFTEPLLPSISQHLRHLDRPKYDFVYLPSGTRKLNNIGLALLGPLMEVGDSHGVRDFLQFWVQ